MKALPKAKENQHTKVPNDSGVEKKKSKSEVIKEAGFTPKQPERFQQLADNPDILT